MGWQIYGAHKVCTIMQRRGLEYVNLTRYYPRYQQVFADTHFINIIVYTM